VLCNLHCSKCSSLGKRAEVLCEENRCLIEPELMEEINLQGPTLGWQAGNYSEFWGRTLRDGVELRLGTLNPSQSVSTREYRDYGSNQKSYVSFGDLNPDLKCRYTASFQNLT